MNAKLAKFIVKGAIGFGVSALIGTIIKKEYMIDEMVDAYFKSRK